MRSAEPLFFISRGSSVRLHIAAQAEREGTRQESQGGRQAKRDGQSDIDSRQKKEETSPSAFLARSEAMERIRGFVFALIVIFAILSLATARPVASEVAGGLNADAVGSAAPIVEARNLRRLRAAPARRVLLDVMPWDTVVDQPGSVASTVRERERSVKKEGVKRAMRDSIACSSKRERGTQNDNLLLRQPSSSPLS